MRLADVGLDADYDKMPADLSGGMRAPDWRARWCSIPTFCRRRAECGLDPITAEIDQLLVDLKKKGATIVVA